MVRAGGLERLFHPGEDELDLAFKGAFGRISPVSRSKGGTPETTTILLVCKTRPEAYYRYGRTQAPPALIRKEGI
jgi:hypothetical protein